MKDQIIFLKSNLSTELACIRSNDLTMVPSNSFCPAETQNSDLDSATPTYENKRQWERVEDTDMTATFQSLASEFEEVRLKLPGPFFSPSSRINTATSENYSITKTKNSPGLTIRNRKSKFETDCRTIIFIFLCFCVLFVIFYIDCEFYYSDSFFGDSLF
jgi:hypothetical protein